MPPADMPNRPGSTRGSPPRAAGVETEEGLRGGQTDSVPVNRRGGGLFEPGRRRDPTPTKKKQLPARWPDGEAEATGKMDTEVGTDRADPRDSKRRDADRGTETRGLTVAVPSCSRPPPTAPASFSTGTYPPR